MRFISTKCCIIECTVKCSFWCRSIATQRIISTTELIASKNKQTNKMNNNNKWSHWYWLIGFGINLLENAKILFKYFIKETHLFPVCCALSDFSLCSVIIFAIFPLHDFLPSSFSRLWLFYIPPPFPIFSISFPFFPFLLFSFSLLVVLFYCSFPHIPPPFYPSSFSRLFSPPPRIFFLQHVTLYALSLFFHRFIRPHSQLSTLPFVIFYIFSTVSIRSMSFNFSTLKLWLPKCFKGHPKHDIARSVSEHKIHLPSLFSIGVFGMVDSKSSQYFIYEVLHVYKLQELCFKWKRTPKKSVKFFLYNFPLISHLPHQI